MAGAGGFEPPSEGSKVPCLTAWLRPKAPLLYKSKKTLSINHSCRLCQSFPFKILISVREIPPSLPHSKHPEKGTHKGKTETKKPIIFCFLP